jgi:dethiobiotin synthetase
MNLFITGTDTEVGKTYISRGLLTAFNQLGYSTLGIKPVASGFQIIDGQIESDTLTHIKHSSIKLKDDEVTAFAFEAAIAPHIAAKAQDCSITVELLNQKLEKAMKSLANFKIIEGCGGWYTPLNHQETMADFVIANQFKVILVVGMRLGCINHALLTCHAMQQYGVEVVGWIANCIDPEMKNRDENIETLKEWLPIPCLGVVEHGIAPETMIDVEMLMSGLN